MPIVSSIAKPSKNYYVTKLGARAIPSFPVRGHFGNVFVKPSEIFVVFAVVRALILRNQNVFLNLLNTEEPRSMDTRLIWTPRYYGQFRLSRQKSYIFPLKLTRLLRAPVYTDNGHFPVYRVTNSYTSSTPH